VIISKPWGQLANYLQRALLAQLAQRMHAHRNTDGDTDEDGEGGTIILDGDDNCQIM
jgi:nuclear receptor interaction protein